MACGVLSRGVLLSAVFGAFALVPAEARAESPDPDSGPGAEVRRGLVAIEAQGKPVAMGTVLKADGRVLTARSPLGGRTTVDVRYADNAVVKCLVAHVDKASDLALLVPQTGFRGDGLIASELDPTQIGTRAPEIHGKQAVPVAISVKGRIDAVTSDGTKLPGVLEITPPAAPTSLLPGTPLLDPKAAVSAVIVSVCREGSAAGVCAPVWVGVPVSTLRSFLGKTPKDATRPTPWLGLGGAAGEGDAKGVRALAVAPKSPAEASGLKASSDPQKADLIVAVDGKAVESPEELAQAIAKRGVGDVVVLKVLGPGSQGKPRELKVTLRAAPKS